jgi:ribokinase
MGARVTMIGAVGKDAFGDELLANLSAGGIDVSRVARSELTTGVALITVSASGENTIVIVPGANGDVNPDGVSAHEEAIAGADALLLQLEVPIAAVHRAAQIAARHGVPVLLNPAPAQPLPQELIRLATYLIPNEHEAGLLAGLPAKNRSDIARAAAALRAMGAQRVIVTMGSRGALVLADGEPVEVASFPVQALDTTAAGDAFVGAFAVALSEGKAPLEATLWGCAAGGLACTAFGAQPSLPRRETVSELLTTPGR